LRELICSKTGSDYFDAIHLSNICSRDRGFVAKEAPKMWPPRRNGNHHAFGNTTIGQIPEYFFQAVGSGTGAIAAWEAILRCLMTAVSETAK
jgi:cysteate synthase